MIRKVENWFLLSLEEQKDIARKVYEEGLFIVCRECGSFLREMHGTHLKNSNCSQQLRNLKEYQKKYFNEPIYSKEHGTIFRRAMKEAMSTPKALLNNSLGQKKNRARETEEHKIQRSRNQSVGQSKSVSKMGQQSRFDNETSVQKAKRIKKLKESQTPLVLAKIGRSQSLRLSRMSRDEKKRFGEAVSRGLVKTIAAGYEPHSNHISGYFYKVFFASSLEYRIIRALRILNVRYRRARGISVPWLNNKSEIKHYSPDFVVEEKKIWEIKPEDQTKDWWVIQKARYARKYACKQSKTYQILVEKDIVEWEKKATKKLGWTYEFYYKLIKKELLFYYQKCQRKKKYYERKRNEKKRKKELLAKLASLFAQISVLSIARRAA